MPTLSNRMGNISLTIDLTKNSYLDIDSSRSNYLNWIPFTLTFLCNKEIVEYSDSLNITFNIREIKKLISNLEKSLINKKMTGVFDKIVFVPMEFYFQSEFYDVGDDGIIGIDIWFNMGYLVPEGEESDFEKGYKFIVEIEALNNFVISLKSQLNKIIS